jgi:hypothetical protein
MVGLVVGPGGSITDAVGKGWNVPVCLAGGQEGGSIVVVDLEVVVLRVAWSLFSGIVI